MTTAEIRERIRANQPEIIEIRKNSAVLLPLVETEEGLSVLYEKRTGNISHAGETCFPGGAVDKSESAEDAVKREVFEELGLREGEDYELYGQFAKFPLITGMCVNIFVGKLNDGALGRIVPSAAEVEEWFTIPVSFMLAGESMRYEYKLLQDIDPCNLKGYIGLPDDYQLPSGRVRMPVWKYGGHVLWGMTARMTRAFLDRFFTD